MASETIADIVAEMRGLAADIEAGNAVVGQTVWRNYADRLEAAAKRDAAIHAMTCEANERLREHLEIALEDDKRTVGNAKAMREALCDIVMLTMKVGYSIHGDVACGIIASKAKHALAAPPRNCDVGTAEEQRRRYDEWRNHDELRAAFGKDEFEWAQMPYEEGGAE